eukprot:6209929-Prymnesium_polylepis.1
MYEHRTVALAGRPEKSWTQARGTMPRAAGSHRSKLASTESGPNIVCVLPEPVCPYARMVAL